MQLQPVLNSNCCLLKKHIDVFTHTNGQPQPLMRGL